ncbi:MAG: hypothetical protein NC177_03650 [Ruminococcus flavefaciens]|nr:hypothetical protein [Ruminococcus flavefaciens]
MSRSYRKFPVIKESHFKDRSPIKSKDFANCAVWKSKEIPSGRGGYKKIYDSYFISDYRFIGYMEKSELKIRYENGNISFSEYQQALYEWKKYYIIK